MEPAGTVTPAPAAPALAEAETLVPTPPSSEAATLPPPVSAAEGTTLPPSSDTTLGPSWAAHVPLPGYQVLGELGRGGMGVVYKARQTKLNRLVAIKMVLAGGHAGAAELERFRTEGEAIARLQHPNIVQVYEVSEHEGRPFFSLEFCAGGSLERKLSGTPLPAKEAAALVETLARAMQAAHEQQVIHRDLKPANVLLTEEGTPKITDFGLAKKLDEAGQTQSGAIMGTPSYMAPEQAGGKSGAIGPAADVYALGAILYECLTGRPPFKAATPLDTILQVVSEEPVPVRQLQPKVPRDLETVCLLCLRKEPRRRYGSAADLADDLRRFQAGEPVAARPVGRVERGWRWCQRNPAVALLLGAVAATLLLGTGISTAFGLWAWQNADIAQVAANDASDQARAAKEASRREAERADGEARARAEVEDQLARTEAARYALQIGAAYRRLNEGDYGSARKVLAECRTHLIGWEHAYLSRVAEGSRVTFHGHNDRIWHLAVSPDGRLVASAAAPHGGAPWRGLEIKVWETDTGREVLSLEGPATPAPELAFSPDSRRLVAHKGNTVMVWDVRDGRLVHTLPLKGGSYVNTLLVFGPGGRLAVALAPTGPTAKQAGAVQVYDVDAGQELWHTPLPAKANPVGLRYTPDGGLTAVCADGAVLAWDMEGTAAPAGPARVPPQSLAVVSSDGKLLAGATGNGVHVWDVATGKETATLPSHSEAVEGLAFSADGKQLAAGGVNGTIVVWDTASGQLLSTLRGPSQRVHALAFCPDGKALVAGSWDWTVRMWDLGGRPDLLPLIGLTPAASALCLSPDGRLAAAGVEGEGRDRPIIKVWDTESGRTVATLRGHTGQSIQVLVFSPDGKRLASTPQKFPTTLPREIKVWDIATEKEVAAPEWPGLLVTALAFSPDGARLAAVGLGRDDAHGSLFRIWDLVGGRELLTFHNLVDKKASAVAPEKLAFNPDGSLLVCDCQDQTVGLWDPTTGQRVRSLVGLPRTVKSIAFSRDGRLLAAGDGTGLTKVWDTASGAELLTLPGHQESVTALVFSLDGKRLASAGGLRRPGIAESDGGELKVWDLGTGQELLSLREHASAIQALQISADGGHLASLARDGVKVRDVSPLPGPLALVGHGEHVEAAVFSPDGKFVASAAADGQVKLWDLATRRETLTLKAHPSGASGVAFSPDGRRLASCGTDRMVRVWDAATGKELVVCRGHTDRVRSVAFSPDGGRVFSAGYDKTGRMWDAATGAEVWKLEGHGDKVEAAAFDPTGRLLATGSADKTVRLWDAATGEAKWVLQQAAPVWDVAFSADGRRVAGVAGLGNETGTPGELKVWDTTTGAEILTIKVARERLFGVTFSPDGKHLAAAGGDNALRVWDTTTGRLLDTLYGHDSLVWKVHYRSDGRALVSSSWDRTVRVWNLEP